MQRRQCKMISLIEYWTCASNMEESAAQKLTCSDLWAFPPCPASSYFSMETSDEAMAATSTGSTGRARSRRQKHRDKIKSKDDPKREERTSSVKPRSSSVQRIKNKLKGNTHLSVWQFLLGNQIRSASSLLFAFILPIFVTGDLQQKFCKIVMAFLCKKNFSKTQIII